MSAKKVSVKDVDTVVVGGGPAGLYALKLLHEASPGMANLGLLESGPSLGGRSKSALHLLDADFSEPFPLLTGTLLAPPIVRWERSWVAMDKVNWNDKEWVAPLPQWKLLTDHLKIPLVDVFIPAVHEDTFLKLQSPVSRLNSLDDGRWEVVTPETFYTVKRLVWAAGIKPFQNAFGKHEAQEFLVANPKYSGVAADFRGGVGLEIEIPRDTVWEEGFRPDGVFALPVRFESKLHLMIGVIHEDGERLVLKTLTHAHQDLLAEPKTVATFQKALRRGIKTLVQGELPEAGEHWVVSDRILGHHLGTPWLLAAHSEKHPSLVFVGDETLLSANHDTLGALDSVAKSLDVGE